MNWLDLIIIAIVATGFTIGFVKGAIKQVFSLGGLILGLILGSICAGPVADFLQGKVSMTDRTAQITAFVLILIIVPFICGLLGHVLSSLVNIAQLGLVNRFLGAVLGGLKYLLALGLIIHLLEYTGLADSIKEVPEGKNSSRFYEPVRKVTDTCLRWSWEKMMTATKHVSGIPVDPEEV